MQVCHMCVHVQVCHMRVHAIHAYLRAVCVHAIHAYGCMCVRVSECMCIYLRALPDEDACTHVYLCIYVYMCTCTCEPSQMKSSKPLSRISTCMHACIYACM